MKNKYIAFLAFATLMLMTSCADSVNYTIATSVESVGFWHGLWHGWILPLAWIVSLFDSDVAVYAIYNNGGWYDFGFVLGAGSVISFGRSSSKRS